MGKAVKAIKEKEVTRGGSTPHQYRRCLDLPMSHDRTMYRLVDVETTDICDAYGFDGNQKDIFKAMCRMDKKEGTDTMYDCNKIVFYALRNKLKNGLITHKEFWEMAVACNVAKEI